MIISSSLPKWISKGKREWTVPNQLVSGGVLASYLRIRRERERGGGGRGCRVEFKGARSDFNLNDGIFFVLFVSTISHTTVSELGKLRTPVRSDPSLKYRSTRPAGVSSHWPLHVESDCSSDIPCAVSWQSILHSATLSGLENAVPHPTPTTDQRSNITLPPPSLSSPLLPRLSSTNTRRNHKYHPPPPLLTTSDKMTRGNQRERDRAKAQKAAQGQKKATAVLLSPHSTGRKRKGGRRTATNDGWEQYRNPVRKCSATRTRSPRSCERNNRKVYLIHHNHHEEGDKGQGGGLLGKSKGMGN